jgi:hypothetical protein
MSRWAACRLSRTKWMRTSGRLGLSRTHACRAARGFSAPVHAPLAPPEALLRHCRGTAGALLMEAICFAPLT